MVAATCCSCDDIKDEYRYADMVATTDWQAAADQSTAALIDYFWNADRGYFNEQSGTASGDGWNYWPQAHAMDVVVDAYRRTGDAAYRTMMDSWYAGGGLAWKHTQPWSKNACSNAPGSLLTLRLYAVEGADDDLAWAKKVYDWTRENLFNPATVAVYDNINGTTGDINTVSLTYNQGTFMASALLLYRITGDEIYLKDARRAANYCISSCIDTSNNVLRNEGEGDGALFKGIFMRYFVDLIKEPALDQSFRNKFVTFLNNNAATAWTKGIADKRQILYGPDWTQGPQGFTSLNAQTSGATLMEAKLRLDNE